MKMGKTKTHVKLYFTAREMEVLDWLVGEGWMGLMATGEGAIDEHVADRIRVGISDARNRYM
jgi:hypothetical protein